MKNMKEEYKVEKITDNNSFIAGCSVISCLGIYALFIFTIWFISWIF
jgi:hypothetical protein